MPDTQKFNQPEIPSAKQMIELTEKIREYRKAVPVAFTLVIVFFFFSFCSFKCNGTEVASISGINLVTGTQPEIKMNNPFSDLTSSDSGMSTGEKVKPNFWAILAFISAIGGAILFYRTHKKENLWGTAIGITGFLSMIILRSVIKSKVGTQTQGMVQIDTSFQFAYWASLLAFLIAAVICYLRLKNEKQIKAHPDKPKILTPPIHISVITTSENKDTV